MGNIEFFSVSGEGTTTDEDRRMRATREARGGNAIVVVLVLALLLSSTQAMANREISRRTNGHGGEARSADDEGKGGREDEKFEIKR